MRKELQERQKRRILLVGSKLISGNVSTAKETGSNDGTCFLDVWKFEELGEDEDTWGRSGVLDELCSGSSFG